MCVASPSMLAKQIDICVSLEEVNSCLGSLNHPSHSSDGTRKSLQREGGIEYGGKFVIRTHARKVCGSQVCNVYDDEGRRA